MSDTIDDIKKSRGRPKTDTTAVMVRIPPDMLAGLDTFIVKEGIPSRPEAIRCLIVRNLVKRGIL